MQQTLETPQIKSKKPIWLIFFCLFLLLTNCLTLSFLGRATSITPNTPLPNLRHIHIGDHDDKLLKLCQTDSFALLGIAEHTDKGVTWTNHRREGGPYTTLLTDTQLKDNTFWRELGLDQPTHPLTNKVIVLIDFKSFTFEYVYCYLDQSNRVVAIYKGSSSD